MRRVPCVLMLLCAATLVGGVSRGDEPVSGKPDAFSVIVMDPLAAPLSCPCVEGYAQRKYEVLAAHLESALGRQVRLTFSEALGKALQGDAKGRADLVIGKHSVVLADAASAKIKVREIAALTGKDGDTTQHGLIVVRSGDAAQTVADLKDYRIFFGPRDCAEKHQAALQLLAKHGVAAPAKIEISQACSDGCTKILEFGADVPAAAVISNYAQPLLQGCGTIKKGDLRVVGKTRSVPFIAAFANQDLDEATTAAVAGALLSLGEKPELLIAMESLIGFVPSESATKKK